MNFILFTENKFNQRDFARMGVKDLFDKGHSVTVIDISPLCRSQHYLDTYFPEGEMFESFIVRIYSYEELEKLIKVQRKDTVALCFMLLYGYNHKIFELISFYSLKYCQFKLGIVPDVISFWTRTRILVLYKYRCIVNYSKVKAADMLFFAGAKSLQTTGSKTSRLTKHIPVGSIDYNNFFLVSETPIKKYNIVFVDDDLPKHPDWEGRYFIDENLYYQKINDFLSALCANNQMTCAVAAHPRSNHKKNPFNYDLHYNATAQLIKNADVIVGHASTSFSYAVLASKPVISLTFSELNSKRLKSVIAKMSKEMGTYLCDLDKNYSTDIPVVDRVKYSHYKKNYLIADESTGNPYFVDALLAEVSKYNV